MKPTIAFVFYIGAVILAFLSPLLFPLLIITIGCLIVKHFFF